MHLGDEALLARLHGLVVEFDLVAAGVEVDCVLDTAPFGDEYTQMDRAHLARTDQAGHVAGAQRHDGAKAVFGGRFGPVPPERGGVGALGGGDCQHFVVAQRETTEEQFVVRHGRSRHGVG
jgi:hypothetical protein